MKNPFFVFVFLTYLPVFFSIFDWETLLDAIFDSASNEYPHCILLTDPLPQNWEIIITFFQVFLIFGVAGFVKSMQCGYSLDQRDLPLEIWVKIRGDMSKIRTKKVVFFYDNYFNSTIMVDSFYWNSIGSWIPTHKIYSWRVFL